ncbi:hypothetical protein SB775_26070 [Peribacillus sp. SIMBA_075]
MNSASLLVSFGVLLVNSASLLVSLGVLLVNSAFTREFWCFTRELSVYS